MTKCSSNITECKLSELFAGWNISTDDTNITGISTDSRKIKLGDLFIAVQGTQASGVDYISDAIAAGAKAVVVDCIAQSALEKSIDVPVIQLPELKKRAGIIISRFYQNPSQDIHVIGVTGTNGKTTVTYLIAQAFYSAQKSVGLIGTLGYGQLPELRPNNHTTPDPITIHALLASWKHHVETAVLEVSSHALDQERVAGVCFDIAVLTNISHDHLDYHKTFERYISAKLKLFKMKNLRYAVLNAHDNCTAKWLDILSDYKDLQIFTYAVDLESEDKLNLPKLQCIEAKSHQKNGDEIVMSINNPWDTDIEITTRLKGQFNLENVLAAFVTLCLSGITAKTAAKLLSENDINIPGRMEHFNSKNQATLVVDYAHTPDALRRVLQTLKTYCRGELYCIFGCGGERDIQKRKLMGKIAAELADHVILTNDNPRSEDPNKIIQDILEDIEDMQHISVQHNRESAITNTFAQATKHDSILIAGKGHETTQKIGGSLLPFDDRNLARTLTHPEYNNVTP